MANAAMMQECMVTEAMVAVMVVVAADFVLAALRVMAMAMGYQVRVGALGIVTVVKVALGAV